MSYCDQCGEDGHSEAAHKKIPKPDDLIPCPFCGKPAIDWKAKHPEWLGFFVGCEECLIFLAREKWQRRA